VPSEDALAAAETAGDEEAYASVLAHAAFAGYRRGDLHAAHQYAERAATRTFTSTAAHYDAVRAQMFSASARGDIEEALHLAMKGRAMARELGRPADAANESANLAESYLELGYPIEGFRCAEAAVDLASASGHLSVELMGNVLCAIAIAENGRIDEALERFDSLDILDHNLILAVDRASTHSYWLLERGAAGDAKRARDIAETAVAAANTAGVGNRMTALHSIIARAWAREGREAESLKSLEAGRLNAGRSEPAAQLLLALAVAEVLPVSAPKRKVALNNARTKILRSATRREDPHAYCTNVRLHRRLLELSGGVPEDLPQAE
jgi:tetratricopeptide (TPR) repeat protein